MTTLTIKGDLELSAAVAEHVAGYVKWEVLVYGPGNPPRGSVFLMDPKISGMYERNPTFFKYRKTNKPRTEPEHIPPFATSADAVLPLCEQFPMTTFQHVCAESKPGVRWIVEILVESPKRDSSPYIDGRGETLARSLCVALLRAKGFQVEFVP